MIIFHLEFFFKHKERTLSNESSNLPSDAVYQADIHSSIVFLKKYLYPQLSSEASQWMEKKCSLIQEEKSDRKFYLFFSSVPRFIPKHSFQLDVDTLKLADKIRVGWQPHAWKQDQACRILMLLTLAQGRVDELYPLVMSLFDTADVGEATAILAALPLLPYPQKYRKLAAEGVRTNMTVALEAISLQNPYPADYLDENAWNQLYLKSVFTERAIYKIYGLERRANPRLATIISDYAHERWAANRVVTPEIWRSIAPFMTADLLEDMKHLLELPDELQQLAAAKVCEQASLQAAHDLLSNYPALAARAKALDWNMIGQLWEDRPQINQ